MPSKKAMRYSHEELEAVLHDRERAQALPTRDDLEKMSPQERTRAADEMVLHYHACAQLGGGNYSAEDLNRVMDQK